MKSPFVYFSKILSLFILHRSAFLVLKQRKSFTSDDIALQENTMKENKYNAMSSFSFVSSFLFSQHHLGSLWIKPSKPELITQVTPLLQLWALSLEMKRRTVFLLNCLTPSLKKDITDTRRQTSISLISMHRRSETVCLMRNMFYHQECVLEEALRTTACHHPVQELREEVLSTF